MTLYNRGSLAVQARAGVADLAARIGRSVGAVIPDVAADFLAQQHLVVVAAEGDDGRVWCSVLTGPAGFLQAVDEGTLAVDATPAAGDPLAGAPEGAEVGTIVLDPSTRRRMRLNGRLRRPWPGRLVVEAEQVVSNCPKYITARRLDAAPTGAAPGSATTIGRRLSPEQADAVRAADTFFIATSGGTGGGLDASHRGGNPGFVQVLDDRTLAWPDYAGNSMFLTLGNVELDPRAGLVFLDWERGSVLQVAGRARTEWSGADERRVVFDVEEVRARERETDGRWALVERSRFNPPT